MRLFLAVLPPAAVLRELAEAVAAAGGPPGSGGPDAGDTPTGDTPTGEGAAGGPAPRAAAAGPGPRWTADRDRHITLAFLGEVAEDTLPELHRRLDRVAGRHGPFPLRLAGAGRFDDRLLWCGVAGDTAAVAGLARSAAAAARRSGIPVPRDRGYRPHLTLARTRAKDRAGLRAWVAALAGFTGAEWTVDGFALVRSHPPTPGVAGATPRYETLRRWALGGAADT